MKKRLATLLVCNLIDAAATFYALTHRLAVEHNPLVRWLFTVHPAMFFAVKLGVAAMAVGVVLSNPDDKSMGRMLTATTLFYGLLSLYQMASIYLWWK